MKDFYICEVSATGANVEPSLVEFKNGVNIIHGASNTGKSMLVDCIDYMFGANEAPFDPADTDYDTVGMVLTNNLGQRIELHRKIQVVDGSPKSDNVISVTSTYPEIENGEYKTGSKGKFNEAILKLLDIKEPVQIIQTQEGRPQSLTLRTFIHQFFVHEDFIFTKDTILDNPRHKGITACLTSLMYLINETGTVENDFESSAIKKAKKKAVQKYISDKFRDIEKRRKELSELINTADDKDPETRINEILDEINQTQVSISDADSECRELMGYILEESSQLQEAEFLQERYSMLRSQYEADIDRLQLIVNGENNIDKGHLEICPFCANEIRSEEQQSSYTSASKAELIKVTLQLKELVDLQQDIEIQIADHMANIGYFHDEHDSMQSLIKGSLRPHMAELNEALSRYRRIIELTAELQANEAMYEVFNLDYNVEEAKDTSAEKYDAKAKFDEVIFTNLAVALSDAIKTCNYPSFRTATISRKSFDAVVNSKHKRNEGQGFRAFLNSLFAFTLMKFLENNAMHPPMMLVLDSPILSLKQNVDIEASEDMKSALFQYIIDNAGDCQVIIAENELPSRNVDYKNTHMIHFTRKEDDGTYGFLVSHR